MVMMARIERVAHDQVGRPDLRWQLLWLCFLLVRLLFLASAAEIMLARLDLPLAWVLPSLFLIVLASAMVSSLAEGGLDRRRDGLEHEAECLLRALLVMSSVSISLGAILTLLHHA